MSCRNFFIAIIISTLFAATKAPAAPKCPLCTRSRLVAPGTNFDIDDEVFLYHLPFIDTTTAEGCRSGIQTLSEHIHHYNKAATKLLEELESLVPDNSEKTHEFHKKTQETVKEKLATFGMQHSKDFDSQTSKRFFLLGPLPASTPRQCLKILLRMRQILDKIDNATPQDDDFTLRSLLGFVYDMQSLFAITLSLYLMHENLNTYNNIKVLSQFNNLSNDDQRYTQYFHYFLDANTYQLQQFIDLSYQYGQSLVFFTPEFINCKQKKGLAPQFIQLIDFFYPKLLKLYNRYFTNDHFCADHRQR